MKGEGAVLIVPDVLGNGVIREAESDRIFISEKQAN